MNPSYKLNEFITACGNGEVDISWQAQNDAGTHFGLRDKKAILQFIVNGGMEQIKFVRTTILEKWPAEKPGRPMVDSYTFTTNNKRVYLAHYQVPTKRWMLKSFKPSTAKPDMSSAPKNFPFAGLNKLLGALENEGSED